jgi:paraquat-inducible protein A
MIDELHLACRDCGAIYHVCGSLPQEGRLRCGRCGAVLWQTPASWIAGSRALVAAAAILLLAANIFPVFDIAVFGVHRRALIASGALALFAHGGAIAAVGGLVALFAVVIPALDLIAVSAVVFRLGASAAGQICQPSAPARIWRAAVWLRQWNMLDVFLLAAVVAYSRLAQLAEIKIGIGGCFLAVYVILRAIINKLAGRERVWAAIDHPAKYGLPAGASWVLCLGCDMVIADSTENGEDRRRCLRCDARMMPRRPGSFATTAAFGLAGLILYVPANLLPVLSITRFGFSTPYTIIGGVRDLAASGLWPLAAVVFVASIAVPALKLASLAWFLAAIRLRSAWLLRQRTVLYRFLKHIGRWSNIDVFVVAIAAALMQFGFIARVEPGSGIASFAGVVLLTMIATETFDPRLMWDAAAARRK